MIGVVDTDVLLKVAQYRLLQESLRILNKDIGQIGALGAARFMMRRRLRSMPELINELEEVLGQLHVVEPSAIELAFAGEIEFKAAERDLELDEGESILFSVVVVRLLEWVVTGDKRAVVALSSLMRDMPTLQPAAGKVICMEHLMLKLLNTTEFSHVRSLICGHRSVDKALDICFSCESSSIAPNNCTEGLMSYIQGLRSRAPLVLAAVTLGDS